MDGADAGGRLRPGPPSLYLLSDLTQRCRFEVKCECVLPHTVTPLPTSSLRDHQCSKGGHSLMRPAVAQRPREGPRSGNTTAKSEWVGAQPQKFPTQPSRVCGLCGWEV
jgi:hypothetical protein